MPKADIVILTVIPEEYKALTDCLAALGCQTVHDLGSATTPNQYGWVTGELTDVHDRVFKIAIGMVLQPGPSRMTSAVAATLTRFSPQYVLIVGIAGGFPQDGLSRGDVAISTVICDYEYGKVAADFRPRMDFTYQIDQTLLTSAISLHTRDDSWVAFDGHLRPTGNPGVPKLLAGAVASGSKIVDDATNEFFAEVLKAWPRLLAVEMEGAGAAAAIETANAAKNGVGFLMIRGISDMPKMLPGSPSVGTPVEGNKAERDTWKKYAASTAARFTTHWISRGWPYPPRRTKKPASARSTEEDDDPPPPSPAPRKSAVRPISKVALTDGVDSSNWLGFEGISSQSIPTEFRRITPELFRMALAAISGQSDRAGSPQASALDAELEVVKSAIDRHQPELAEAKLDELERRASDKLLPQQWYQLKVLRSRIFLGRWEWERAGRILLDAKRHAPATERARINEALGYEMIGERERAHALAADLRAEFPHVARVVTIWVRTAPPTASFASLAAVAAPFAKEDEELTLALAHRALVEDCCDEAAPLARRATELDAECPHAWFVLGNVEHASGLKAASPLRMESLRKAMAHYSRAIDLAQSRKFHGLEAAIRFARGQVRHVLGDPGAEVDYQRAAEQGRPEQGLRTEYAGFLVELGRANEALRELAAERGSPTSVSKFYEAAARHQRNIGDDRLQAVTLLRELIGSEPGKRWADAHALLVQWATENQTQSEARATIQTTKLRQVHPLVYHTLSGWLSHSEGKTEEAKTALLEAMKSSFYSVSRHHLFLLAQVLISVGEDEHALPVLERCYRRGVFDVECRTLLDCAQRLERYDVSIGVCHELRLAGEFDPRIIQTEISLRQIYDPGEALKVAHEYLAAHPLDRFVTLWQSTLALRLDQRDLLVSDLSRLPDVGDLTPQGAGLVINILRATGQAYSALKYAYEVLRANFDQEFAHGQFLAHFLELSNGMPELRGGNVAILGMAVCYREEYEELDRWVVLEDSPEPELARGELGPAHPVTRALTGRQVGENVVVSDSGVQERSVTVREVCHKFVHCFRDCSSQFQVRFPGGSAIQLVQVGSEEKGFDPSVIVTTLKGRKDYIDALDAQYRKAPLPFATYVELAGCGEFAAWRHLISDPTLGIRCFDGRDDGLREGVELARSSKVIVLDLTALITLAHLDLLRVLGTSARVFVVSQETFDRIQHILEDANDERTSPGSVHLADREKLVVVESSSEQRGRHRAFIEGIRDAVRKDCHIRPCPQAVGLPPAQRNTIIKALGKHNLESMLLAAQPESVLWSDDIVVGILARTDFQTRRTWTQAALFVLRHDGTLTQRDYDQAVARLVGWHYQSTRFNEDTLVAAAEIAEWRMERWPVAETLRWMGDGGVDAMERLRLAALATRCVWQRELPYQDRQGFLFGLLSGMGSEALIRRFYQEIPGLFSVDVFSSDEVRDCISVWLRMPTNRILKP